LPAGAIAGIAIGGAAVLVAIGILTWFCLRRRRLNSARSKVELSKSPDPANHYISGKTVNDVDPQSPYSDDGGPRVQEVPLGLGAAAGPRGTHHPATFTPDNVPDQPIPLARTVTDQSFGTHSNHSPVENPRRIAAERRDTAMSGNVAHLVEDGMTPDDIRRLAEEEHELDLEIERAGRDRQ